MQSLFNKLLLQNLLGIESNYACIKHQLLSLLFQTRPHNIRSRTHMILCVHIVKLIYGLLIGPGRHNQIHDQPIRGVYTLDCKTWYRVFPS
jgi:hypothetical protein